MRAFSLVTRAPLLLALGAPAAQAAVTASGPLSITVSEPGSLTTDLLIGTSVGNGSDPNTGNPQAIVRVNGGSLLQYDQTSVGHQPGYFGRMFVTGAGTRFHLDSSGTTINPTLVVGEGGYGYLEVTGEAFLDLSDSSGNIFVGRDASGIGELVVKDLFTFASIGGDLTVGVAGLGRMSITNGAIFRTESTTSDVTLGGDATGTGYLTVSGSQSMLVIGDDLVVGGTGVGVLSIADGAIVDADRSALNSQGTIGALGRIELSGGAMNVTNLDVNGLLRGDGIVRGGIDVLASGALETLPNQVLRLQGPVSNVGAITAAGEIDFLGTLTNPGGAAPGTIGLEGGTIRLSQALANAGVIASASGATNVHGTIANTGRIVVATDSVATFHDSVTTSGGGQVSVLAGGNALFLSNVSFVGASSLALGLSDPSADPSEGANLAQVSAQGPVALAGSLTVTAPAGFAPVLGQSFLLIDAPAGITGTFGTVTLPTAPMGLQFDLVYSGNSLVMATAIDPGTVFFPGDFNGDGLVNAADYTTWRDALDSNNPLVDGAGNANGVVDQADYAVWVANYGNVAPSSATAVPEPGAIALAGVAAVFGSLSRKRRR
ncbi:MAG: hypothetical protein ACRCT8_16660 [Lacipirellulaceae bacterium]